MARNTHPVAATASDTTTTTGEPTAVLAPLAIAQGQHTVALTACGVKGSPLTPAPAPSEAWLALLGEHVATLPTTHTPTTTGTTYANATVRVPSPREAASELLAFALRDREQAHAVSDRAVAVNLWGALANLARVHGANVHGAARAWALFAGRMYGCGNAYGASVAGEQVRPSTGGTALRTAVAQAVTGEQPAHRKYGTHVLGGRASVQARSGATVATGDARANTRSEAPAPSLATGDVSDLLA